MTDDLVQKKMQFFLSLRQHGVNDSRVLAAMEKVDRGLFVRGLFTARAYEDMPLPIACGQTISQPSVVGLMTQAAEVSDRDTVLEVGTGSGYQTAILSRLSRLVYTIERYRTLMKQAEGRFKKLGLTVSDSTGKSAEKFNDTIDLIGQGLKGIAAQIAEKILPTLESLAGKFFETMSEGNPARQGADAIDEHSPAGPNDLRQVQHGELHPHPSTETARACPAS